MIDVADIEQRLRDDVKALAQHLLPNAKVDGNYLKVGSVQGETGQSMVIFLSGARKGKWEDFAGGDYGDMLDLIQATKRLPGKGDAVAWAKQWLGIADAWTPASRGPSPDELRQQAAEQRARVEQQQQAEAAERAAKIRGAKSLYLNPGSLPIAGTPAEWYLRSRLLEPLESGWPGALRFNPEVWCKAERVKLPTMLAPIYLADGSQVATHRTYLQLCDRRGWCKIDSGNAKMVLGPMGGGFVPINKGASGKSMRHMLPGEPVYVTEGIEDAITVRMKKPEARIICAITLGNIGAIVLPEAAQRLIIVADRDENVKAQEALERAIARQQARGLEVGIVMPPKGVKDFNDWLRAGASGRGAA
jgi:phage/plasmid primase-like uncharacterized protein